MPVESKAMSASKTRLRLKLTILVVATFAGMVLTLTGVLDGAQLLRAASGYSRLWWFPLLLIGLQGLMFAVGWPGSVLYWAAGTLYAPLQATVIIVLGGTGGALIAYSTARKIKNSEEQTLASSKHLAFLERHSGFAELCALRTMPNIPHALINYGSGLLNVPIATFLTSTLIGFSIKGFLYASAIHGMTSATSSELARRTLLPLILLAALFIGGKAIMQKTHAVADR